MRFDNKMLEEQVVCAFGKNQHSALVFTTNICDIPPIFLTVAQHSGAYLKGAIQ